MDMELGRISDLMAAHEARPESIPVSLSALAARKMSPSGRAVKQLGADVELDPKQWLRMSGKWLRPGLPVAVGSLSKVHRKNSISRSCDAAGRVCQLLGWASV